MNFHFTACRDHTTYAVYALQPPLPIVVRWPTCTQTLRIKRFAYPPHLTLEFESIPPSREGGTVYELEDRAHGERITRCGLKVASPSALDAFCARLVAENRATLIAGRHSEVPWSSHILLGIDRRHPETQLDAFWSNPVMG